MSLHNATDPAARVHQPAPPELLARKVSPTPSRSTIQGTISLCRFRFRHVLIALLGNIPAPFHIVTGSLVVVLIVLHYCHGWRFLEGMTLQLIRNSIITLWREQRRNLQWQQCTCWTKNVSLHRRYTWIYHSTRELNPGRVACHSSAQAWGWMWDIKRRIPLPRKKDLRHYVTHINCYVCWLVTLWAKALQT